MGVKEDASHEEIRKTYRVTILKCHPDKQQLLQDMTVEDAGDCFEFYYHCRCGDCFFVDSLELEEMGYKLSSSGKKISLQTPGSLPASVVLPCGSCSTKVRLYIDAEVTLWV
ncbi:hypothetical protein F511_02590 [Dorcoceras hygrometricum]|uniref:DPH-type MB domain-containing protein n=1 Tax=Dorcoceras hygrometricum TaxID=472368 RepID=A0A2Z7ALJ1_9LAMI|nr:hypothetical protein F511_02590 [Dorcoceras hygrometricum]